MRTVTTTHNTADTIDALFSAQNAVDRKIRERLVQKGAGLFVDPHQIYGIVAEEAKELMDALHKNNLDGMRDELADIAVAAIWGIASIDAFLDKEDVSA